MTTGTVHPGGLRVWSFSSQAKLLYGCVFAIPLWPGAAPCEPKLVLSSPTPSADPAWLHRTRYTGSNWKHDYRGCSGARNSMERNSYRGGVRAASAAARANVAERGWARRRVEICVRVKDGLRGRGSGVYWFEAQRAINKLVQEFHLCQPDTPEQLQDWWQRLQSVKKRAGGVEVAC